MQQGGPERVRPKPPHHATTRGAHAVLAQFLTNNDVLDVLAWSSHAARVLDLAVELTEESELRPREVARAGEAVRVPNIELQLRRWKAEFVR